MKTFDVPQGRKVCNRCSGVSFDRVDLCPSCGSPRWWTPAASQKSIAGSASGGTPSPKDSERKDAVKPARLLFIEKHDASSGIKRLFSLVRGIGKAGKEISVNNGDTISLPADTTLTAVDNAEVGVPVTAVVGEKNIGTVISCDFEAELWSHEGKGHPSLGVLIWVGVPIGKSIRLSKSSVIVVAPSSQRSSRQIPLSLTDSVGTEEGIVVSPRSGGTTTSNKVMIRFVFLKGSIDVKVFIDGKEIDGFQAGSPSRPQVAGNGVEVTFSNATVNKSDGLPVPLMNAALTLQGRLGNHQDVRSPAGEDEVMHAVRSLKDTYLNLAERCVVSTTYLRVEES